MPAIQSGGSGVRARHAPPKKKAPYQPHPAARPKPVGVFARPVVRPPGQGVFTPARRQANARVDRAKRRAPVRAAPVIPTIRNPTRQQQRAVNRAVSRDISRRIGPGGSGRERQQRQRAVLRQVRNDPRLARLNSALVGASRTNTQRLALKEARSAHVRGSRQQRLRAGRRILEARAARDRVSAGPRPKVLTAGPASVNLTAAARAIMGATSLSGDSAENRFFRAALGDVGMLATGPFVGGYAALSAGAQAAQGNTRPARQLARGVYQGLKESVPGQLVQGDVEGAAREFQRHPVLALLDVAGAASVGGRTAGALARGLGSHAEAEGVRGALARAGSTVRPPLASFDDPAAARSAVSRRYSKDPLRKAMQVMADQSLEPLKRADGSVVTKSDRGRQVPVLLARQSLVPGMGRERIQRAEANFAVSRANASERQARDEVGRQLHIRGIRGRDARDLAAMAYEGTITTARHFEQDLKAHAQRLRGELAHPENYRDTGELYAAQRRLRLVESALKDPRVLKQKAKIVAAGEAAARRVNEGQAEAIRLGMLHPKRAERARRVPVAVEHLGAKYFTPEELRDLRLPGVSKKALKKGQIRHANGRFMGNDEVDAFLRSRGRDPESVAYLPHRMDVRGRRAFHAQFTPGGRPVLDKPEMRTGEAYRRGGIETSAALIREQGVGDAVKINKARMIDRLATDHGVTKPDGSYFTSKEAQEFIDRARNDTGEEFVAMRAFPARLDKATRDMIREDRQAPGQLETLPQRLLNSRILHESDKAKNVVLLPKAMVDQMQRHLQPVSGAEKFMQMLNRPFRTAVLAQPRWLMGNFVEPYIVRLTTNGAGLNVFGLGVDIAAATRLARRMERSADWRVREAGAEIGAQQMGTGLFVGSRGAMVRRSAEEMPFYGKLVQRLPALRQAHEMLGIAAKMLLAPGSVFFKANRVIETLAQRAALGKSVREDIQDFTGSWTKTLTLQKSALDDVAKGLVNTPAQRRFMRAQHEMLGKYEGYPPWLRRATQSFTPFIPWMLNAARFVFWTMPAHRTAQTALLLKVNDVVAKEWERKHQNLPPGALKFAVPTKDGGWLDLARYTPFGFGVDLQQGQLDQVLAQIAPPLQGPFSTLKAKQNPFGDPLQVEGEPYGSSTTGQRVGIAANQFAEAVVPYLSQARRLREGGSTAYDSSNVFDPDVKPGTKTSSAISRVYNPLRPTYLGGKGQAEVTVQGPSRGGSLDDRLSQALEEIGSETGPSNFDDRLDAALAEMADERRR